jgi:hypothetical protein
MFVPANWPHRFMLVKRLCPTVPDQKTAWALWTPDPSVPSAAILPNSWIFLCNSVTCACTEDLTLWDWRDPPLDRNGGQACARAESLLRE